MKMMSRRKKKFTPTPEKLGEMLLEARIRTEANVIRSPQLGEMIEGMSRFEKAEITGAARRLIIFLQRNLMNEYGKERKR